MFSTGAPENVAWESLDAVADAVRSCTRCELAHNRTKAVPGDGSPRPTIMFIGEGPGFTEDQQGLPFVGRAGELLDELLEQVPLRREDVYITNIVKCRPPENRDPLPAEAAACRPYLEAQIGFLQPRVIATLGRHSLTHFFPDARISDSHGRPMRWRDLIVYPLYHPAAGLRSTKLRTALEEDFANLPQAVVASLELSAKAPKPEARKTIDAVAENRPAIQDDAEETDKPQLSLF